MGSLDLSQDTIRQRRNLIVTSALLIFVGLADVEFGNTVTFSGVKLTIGKPEMIHQGLLVLLVYSLWRFYQYFTTDNAYSEHCKQFGSYMSRFTTMEIVKSICKIRGLTSLSGEYLYKNLSRDSFLTYSIDAAKSSDYDPVVGEMKQDTFRAEISVIKLEVSRLMAAAIFAFRVRILTDYFIPYILVIYAVYLQFV